MLKTPKRIFWGLAAIGLLSFAVLTFVVSFFPPSKFDIYITQEIQKGLDLKEPMTWISIWGNSWVPFLSVLFISFLYYSRGFAKESHYVLLTLVADAYVILLKWIVNRPRPPRDLVDVVHQFHQTSFPSGHVVHYVVFFGFILVTMILNKEINLFVRSFVILCCAILIVTVSISRVYLGAHWITDVAGGYLIGFLTLAAIVKLYLRKTP